VPTAVERIQIRGRTSAENRSFNYKRRNAPILRSKQSNIGSQIRVFLHIKTDHRLEHRLQKHDAPCELSQNFSSLIEREDRVVVVSGMRLAGSARPHKKQRRTGDGQRCRQPREVTTSSATVEQEAETQIGGCGRLWIYSPTVGNEDGCGGWCDVRDALPAAGANCGS
jgi:hypothetical protein